MAPQRKISQEEYDEFRSRMEEKYGYEDMTDEEKAEFDAKLDQVAVVDKKTDTTDTTDDEVVERGDIDGGHRQKNKDAERFF